MTGSWKSMVHLELTAAETARTLTAANEGGISLYRVEQTGELTARFWVRRGDCEKLRRLCAKRGDNLKLLERRGLYWLGLGMLRRPVLMFGILLMMILGFWLPSRVLFVRVEGNRAIPPRQILDAAESCGVGFGASRRHVRSEKVKNALLQAIPELQWAGVNTSGCVAVVSVRERSAPAESAVVRASGIAAARDGFILSADVTRGTALVRPGQTVKKGQTLVSGYENCGICIRATGAEGEILAQTKREIRVIYPAKWAVRGAAGDVKRKYSLIFRKKRINLWKDSGICDTTCGRMYKEYHVTLPGGFRLPLSLCIEEYTHYEAAEGAPQAEGALKEFAEAYLKQQMVSGTILSRNETVSRTGDLYCLEGSYDCTEMIGRIQKIGETNGKRD